MTPFLTRVTLTVVLAVASTSTWASTLLSAQSASNSAIAFRPLRFETREGRKRTVDAEEGMLTVPASRTAADGRTMQLHVVRFRSTSKQPGPPIVYLAGGPGGSGSTSAAGDRFDWFMAMREVGDVIAFDQRGTYGSQPYAVCPGSWSYPATQPLNRDSLTAVMRRWAPACVTHWRAKGIDSRDFNTEENADDLEALKTALGVPQISIVGISYGTHLGLSFIRRHPNSVARAVLAGVEGPDHTLKLPSNLDASLRRVDSLMRLDHRMNDVPSLIATLHEVLAKLAAQPTTVTVKDHRGTPVAVTIGPLDVQRALAENLGERNTIERLPAAILAIARGDYTPVATASHERGTEHRELVMAIAMDCASGASPARLARIAQEVPQSLLGDVINYPYLDMCDVWPHRDLGDAFRAPITSSVPTLFVSGSLDARTPPSNADEIKEGFARASSLLIENGGHDDDLLIASPAIGAAMREFLAGKTPSQLVVVLPPLQFKKQL